MASYVATYGDVSIGYNDAWQHPCGAPKKDGTPCGMLIKNGLEHCRWHTPAVDKEIHKLERSRAYFLRRLDYTKNELMNCRPTDFADPEHYQKAAGRRWVYLKQWTEALEEAEKALAELRTSKKSALAELRESEAAS